MGFFDVDTQPKVRQTSQRSGGMPSVELLWQHECRLCSLNKEPLQSPKMKPSGVAKPFIYMLGEAPGANEDRLGEQFVGDSGSLLRAEIPSEWIPFIRWNNSIRCRPPKNRKPEKLEIECCRPSIIKDIEEAKPNAIFCFGEVPMTWITGSYGISNWRGRRLPVQIGSHVCWAYIFHHPAYILRQRDNDSKKEDSWAKQITHIWKLDIKRALAEVEAGLPIPVVHTVDDAEKDVSIVTGRRDGDLERVVAFLEKASGCPETGLDYETSALRPYRPTALIATASISIEGETLAFPFYHPQAGWTANQLEILLKAFVAYLVDKRSLKIVQNSSFEAEWTGVKFDHSLVNLVRWIDTGSQAFTIDERVGDFKPGCISLAFLTQLYFGLNIKKLSSVNVKTIMTEPLETVLRYNGIDAKYHRLLYAPQKERIEEEGLTRAFELMNDRIRATVLMQIRGMSVDQKEVLALEKKYAKRIMDAEAKIQQDPDVIQFTRKTGSEFNPHSSQDVIAFFRDFLGFKKEGSRFVAGVEKYSADEETLHKINHPVALMIISLRTDNKRLSTYITPLKVGSSILYPDGCIHTNYNTTLVSTTRTSSDEPNVQNYTKRDKEGKEVRKQVVARPGYILAAFDYGQIQVRNICMESNDKELFRRLWERHDLHKDWTQKLAEAYPERVGGERFINEWDKPKNWKKGDPDPAMKLFRTDVKNQWTFPLFFGANMSTVSFYLKIPETIIKPFYDEFWDTFRGVREWQDKKVKVYKELGYVENLTGHRRHGPMSINEVINSPIQADEADIVLDAATRICDLDIEYLYPIIEIHDDLTFELPEDKVDEAADIILEKMLFPPFDFINVPITVEMAVGPNWMQLEEVATFSSDKWGK